MQSPLAIRLARLAKHATDIEATPVPFGKLDRRLSPRQFCNLTAQCTSVRQPGVVFTIKIQDISLGGIGFISEKPFGRSEILQVTFRTARGVEAITKLVRTKHVRVEEGGEHFHGCTFAKPLDAPTLDWLLGKLVID
jgi:PilZ domain